MMAVDVAVERYITSKPDGSVFVDGPVSKKFVGGLLSHDDHRNVFKRTFKTTCYHASAIVAKKVSNTVTYETSKRIVVEV